MAYLIFLVWQGGQNPDEDLLNAAMNGNIGEVVAALNRGANVNAQDPNNATALHFAAGLGNVDLARTLITHGARVNVADIVGGTPLHNAVLADNPYMVKLLLDKGADPTTRDTNGQTPADLLRNIGPAQQQGQAAQQIRQYFTQAAHPLPRLAPEANEQTIHRLYFD